MAIDNARLPTQVEQGAQGGPLFKTTVLMAASGDEQRIPEWDIARGEWDIGYGINNKTTLLLVIGFFRAVLGKAHAFRFRDWSDYQATDATFGTGDGSTTQFQLKIPYRSYQDDETTVVRTYTRSIYLPASSPLTIKDNGSTVNPADYTLQTGGTILFDTAPTNAHILTWTGEFDVPVRFDIDKLPTAMLMDDVGSIRGIRIVEVLDSVT
jgi:uncharacterized protein (TIGR02217 family)